jgi:hypothetical protein
MEKITNWWIEYVADDELFISLRRHLENRDFFEINFMIIDEEGDEDHLAGAMRDNHTYLDMNYLAEQWFHNRIHPDDLNPNREV